MTFGATIPQRTMLWLMLLIQRGWLERLSTGGMVMASTEFAQCGWMRASQITRATSVEDSGTSSQAPMRKYCLGAALLDRNDPSRVIGRLKHPLLRPGTDEREGYVPNVLYSCGALIHGGNLVLPYAVSDTSSRFAIVPVADLLRELVRR